MSLTIFGEIADSFDARVEEAIRELDWWVDQYRRDDDSMVDYYAAAAVSSVTQSFMQFASGFVDVLRLGEGVQEGSWSGLGEDALRLLVVAGPALRVSSGAFRALRLLAVERQAAGTMHCYWISTVRAAREAGRHRAMFVSVDRLARTAGLEFQVFLQRLGRLHGTTPEMFRRLQRALSTLGIRFSRHHSFYDLNSLLHRVGQSRTSSFIFAIVYDAPTATGTDRAAHAMYSVVRRGRTVIVDTDSTLFTNLTQLERAYPNARIINQLDFPTLEIPQSVLLVTEDAAVGGSILTIGLRVVLERAGVLGVERRGGNADGTQGRRTPALPRRPH